MEKKRFFFPFLDNHRLHPPLDFFSVPYSTWSRCIARGIVLGLCVQYGKEKVDLQSAMEVTKIEPPAFEELLCALLLHVMSCFEKPIL